MNKFKENEQFSVVLSSGHQNEHFQEIACSRLVYLNENFYIFIKWTDFSEISWSQEITNEQISRDFLLDIKRHTFGEKYQFFQPNALPFGVIT